MTFVVQCVSCHRRYGLNEQMAGKKVKCKECGTVFVARAVEAAHAAQATASSAAAARAGRMEAPSARPLKRPVAHARQASAPPAMPARMTSSDDPFAAMSLLEAGTPLPPESSGPMYAGASMAAPPVVAPLAAQLGQPYAYAIPQRRPVRSTKSVSLDPLTPILLLCLIVGLVAVLIIGLNRLPDRLGPDTHPLVLDAAKTALWSMMISFGVAHFAVIAPLCLLAVFVASKIMSFELPGAAYLRSAGVAALPLVVYMGMDVLAPNNVAIRLILIVAILPLGFYVLKNIFELLISEALVAYGFTCVFFIVGLVLSMMLSGVVAAAGVVQSKSDIQKAIREEQEKKWQEQRDQMRAQLGTPSYVRPDAGGNDDSSQDRPAPMDPWETRAQSLHRRLESFDSRDLASQSRESAGRDFASLQVEVNGAAASLRSRPEWGSIESLAKSIQQKIAALPSEQPDPAIFEVLGRAGRDKRDQFVQAGDRDDQGARRQAGDDQAVVRGG